MDRLLSFPKGTKTNEAVLFMAREYWRTGGAPPFPFSFLSFLSNLFDLAMMMYEGLQIIVPLQKPLP